MSGRTAPRVWTVENMADHITVLADEHGVTVEPHSSGGRSWRRRRLIWVRPVKSPVTYAVALHEMGHVLARGGGSGPRLVQEAAAWRCASTGACSWGPFPHEHDRVYLADDPDLAEWFAVAARGRGVPKVLTVTPAGRVEVDDLAHEGDVVREFTADAAFVVAVRRVDLVQFGLDYADRIAATRAGVS